MPVERSVLIVGSMALDSIATPFASVKDAVGGSAIYAGYAATLFAPVRLVGVVGDDFPSAVLEGLKQRGADLDGVQRVPGGRSFRWAGSYSYALAEASTEATELNVFGNFHPALPESYRDSSHVFLANIMPALQLGVLDQMRAPCFTMCDTMNLWIETARQSLLEVLGRVDLALMNDSELRQLTGLPNLTRAAQEVLALGPRYLIVKKGEYGAALVSREGQFALPCFPLPDVVDPTGAGDSFAGGFIGALAWLGATDGDALRQALAFGTATASACVSAFSVAGLEQLDAQEIHRRYEHLREMVRLDQCSLNLADRV